MEWLKKILESAEYGENGKLDVDKTIAKINTEFPKHAVPKDEYNAKAKELETVNATLADLKKNNLDNEQLQNAIKENEKTIKTLKLEHEEEIKGLKIDSEITKLLSDNKAKYPELLATKFDRSKIQLSDGKTIGLQEQFKDIKDSYKDMFEQTITGKPPVNPDTKGKGSSNFETLVNNADTMTAEEVAAQFAEMEKQ